MLEISTLHAAYADGSLTPVQVCETLLDRIEAYPDNAVFIARVPRDEVLARAAEADPALPLYGIPFVVKDNIDVAGMATTAACPDFAYTAEKDATVVAKLLAAGAILLGKSNLDQFATGLNGTRSPYGAPRCVFDSDYISGGSSSGSAVSVGAGLAVFSLGTDTAGSGRVPAMINNLLGLKPTIGRISAAGMVPACKSLDCVSVFANSVADAMAVLAVAEGFDGADAFSRAPATQVIPGKRAGVLAPKDRDFAGNAGCAALYEAALAQAAALGWELVAIDYAPLKEIAAALYGGPLAAERVAALGEFYKTSPDSINPVVRTILDGAAGFSAAELFAEQHRIQGLRHAAQAELGKADFLLLPTAPTIFTVEAMLADPIGANAKLGLYTNFVNIMDLAALAVPAGFTPAGLPFGVTLIGPAFSEASLAGLGDELHRALGAGAGVSRDLPTASYAAPAADEVSLVVAGAHLSGMVLNHELVSLGARLEGPALTAPDYRLFALATTPPKPGLVYTPGFAGAGIAVEVWALSPAAFGRFVAKLPAPMGIGRVILADGSVHPGFLCEAFALEGAGDITSYGGWRAYTQREK